MFEQILKDSIARWDGIEDVGSLTLLLLELLHVELELLALEDVSIAASGLSRSGRDAGEESTEVELVSDLRVNDTLLSVVLDLSLDVTGLLFLSLSLLALFNLLLVQLNIVMLQVPLSEGVGIDSHNAVLHDGLGSNQLVVGSVVNDIQNSGLSGKGLGAPGEGAVVDLEGSSLDVATSGANESDSLSAELGGGRNSAHFELSFLLVNGHPSSGSPSLVPGISVNSHNN
eukprot:CAMPEP_0170479064 /NCGR_PEP_ID=MMETSP0208-20121228/421_1 /TAXON_ID=197538 /ORGANISM="Strombidium inclinatum, Strain S3" /LENGTH=228 /DNA_ID=CAMNT_0010751405 /DNA_START=109 /DNA_END=796 /DNA_ORIENTATION=+